MKGKDIAYIAGTLLAGFAAYKIYRVASDVSAAGGKTLDAVLTGAKQVVTEDLNPASDKNIIYKGVSSVVSSATGRDETLGTWLYGVFNKDPDMTVQISARPTGHENNDAFRASEIKAENADVATSNSNEKLMSDRKTSFRLSELRTQNGEVPSMFDNFLLTIAGQK